LAQQLRAIWIVNCVGSGKEKIMFDGLSFLRAPDRKYEVRIEEDTAVVSILSTRQKSSCGMQPNSKSREKTDFEILAILAEDSNLDEPAALVIYQGKQGDFILLDWWNNSETLDDDQALEILDDHIDRFLKEDS
jgi:co-chaperonin GroES (HSP10)